MPEPSPRRLPVAGDNRGIFAVRPPAHALLGAIVMMKPSFALGGCLLLVPVLFLGCIAPEEGTGGGGGSYEAGSDGDGDGTSSTKAGGAGKTSGNGTSGSESTTGSGATSGGGDCGSMATYEECDACACEANTAGCDAYWEFEGMACACDAGAPCEAECANACTNDVEDPACDACYEQLTGDEACFQASYDACTADADCNAYLQASAVCAELPDE